MAGKVLFSDWLRAQGERKDDVGEVSRLWNAQPFAARKGRCNAARIWRQLPQVSLELASKVVAEYGVAKLAA